jgi:tripartite-type tricarboxylate transporter receptor subunit TctC
LAGSHIFNNEKYVKEAEKFLVTPTYLNPEEANAYMKKAEEKYIELNKE